jgi:hypothetical protein
LSPSPTAMAGTLINGSVRTSAAVAGTAAVWLVGLRSASWPVCGEATPA